MARASNLGTTRLRRRKRAEDPMRAFDALPPPLRRWLTEAAMPWSPASCRKLWKRARAEGAPVETILERLDRAEEKCLTRISETYAPRDAGQTSQELEGPR